MAFYTGRAYESDFITKLVEHLTAIPQGGTEPYWNQVNSGTFLSEGVILESRGMSGNESIFVQIKKVNNYSISMQLLHGYVPNQISGLNGTFVSATPVQNLHWFTTSYPVNYTFDYWVSFDRDRIMLFLSADKLVTTNPIWGSFTWIGLPNRLSAESDSTAAFMATSRYAFPTTQQSPGTNFTASYGIGTLIRDRFKTWNKATNMYSTHPFKSVGWGGQVFLPHIFLDSGDGARAILHGVHPLVQNATEDDFRHGDEVTVASKRYTIFKIHANANFDPNGFTTDWIAVEQLR